MCYNAIMKKRDNAHLQLPPYGEVRIAVLPQHRSEGTPNGVRRNRRASRSASRMGNENPQADFKPTNPQKSFNK